MFEESVSINHILPMLIPKKWLIPVGLLADSDQSAHPYYKSNQTDQVCQLNIRI